LVKKPTPFLPDMGKHILTWYNLQSKENFLTMKGSDKLLIYNKLKEICKEKDISIASVEKKAGLGNGTITKWNSSKPTIDNLKAVADVLEINIMNFLDDTER